MKPKRPLAERFWAQVKKTGETGCWLWTGYQGTKGCYISLDSSAAHKRSVPRVAWELTMGQIPAGLSILHRCDVPSCVNPCHLFLGTQRDNMRDAIQKQRLPQSTVKLNAEAIREIRRTRRYGSAIGLAHRYGVSTTTIYRARNGRMSYEVI